MKQLFLLLALLLIHVQSTLTIQTNYDSWLNSKSNSEEELPITHIDTDIEYILKQYLTRELNDTAIADELTTIIINTILKWRVPTIAPNQITTIVAYAFGNRILPNGNRLPGPTNEALADLVVQLHKETDAPVYAQWEIIDAIGDRINPDKLTPINPTLNAQANVVYLSTADVASTIIEYVNDPEKLGTVGVIAFDDHMYRCIKISRDAGINAYKPDGYSMPSIYDTQSGQPWTRSRIIYLIADIKSRITNQLETRITH